MRSGHTICKLYPALWRHPLISQVKDLHEQGLQECWQVLSPFGFGQPLHTEIVLSTIVVLVLQEEPQLDHLSLCGLLSRV